MTDMVISPLDGAMYFITGGWRIQTGLYRDGHAEKELVVRTSGALDGRVSRSAIGARIHIND